VFRATGAYLTGHFRLTSGMHSSQYLQCALVLQHPGHAERLGRQLAEQARALLGGPVTLVASPALGGLIVGHEVARALGARHIFTERDANAKMTLRHGFAPQPGERALVVEDVVTTGGSSLLAIERCESVGLKVQRVLAIIDRLEGGREAFAESGYELTTLFTIRDFGIVTS